ncbi:MAG: gliding motility-associated C-terminal domain-containing protein, partial [Bacteroidota bacterium]
MTYIENDRSNNIVNIFNSGDTPYVTFVKFSIIQGQRCNNLPVLTVPPLDKACNKVAFLHNPGAFDPDGDSLSYELSIPAGGLTQPAIYTSPVDPRLYTSFTTGNEDGTGPPTFGINSVTGLLTWDAPGLLGEYN